jgi:hypothetical protein
MSNLITELYAFIAVDADGDEGITGFCAADGTWMPLIGADMARVGHLRPIAQLIADATGATIELRYFSASATRALETIIPRTVH